MFFLVESKTMPSHLDGLKKVLQENEPFESAFINASEEQCKSWALEKQFEVNFIEQNIIGIADARTAGDGTMLMSRYKTDVPPEDFPNGAVPSRRRSTPGITGVSNLMEPPRYIYLWFMAHQRVFSQPILHAQKS